MPVFNFQAIDRDGKTLSGQMPAASEIALEQKLSETGIWLMDARLQASKVEEKAKHSKRGWFDKGVTRRQIIDFCTLMTFQCKVGVPLLQALEVARQDCENPYFGRILGGMQKQIEAGMLSYEAMERFPQAFTPHFVSVIRAGETSGKLPEAFHDLREYLEWVDRVLAEVRQASLYPAITATVVSGFVIGLFIFIIPRFAQLLGSVNAKLPLLTELVFGASDFLKGTWWVWLGIIPFIVISALIARRYSKKVERWFDKTKLSMPVFGPLNTMLAISRFTHNLAILYGSGIPIINALELCRGLTGSILVEDAVAAVAEAVKSGATLSEAIRKHPIFPPLLVRMVVMGETTGNLDRALQNVSDYYNEIIPRRIKKIVTVIEPAMTLFLIGLVGLVALSIYLPILSLMGTIGK
jgi:type II secretory pathway component PulF